VLFFNLARYLFDYAKDESWFRSSISRAYYACHLTAKEALRTMGYSFTGTGKDHELVIIYLKRMKKRKTANKLDKLKKYRKGADYDLTETISKTSTGKVLLIAEYVLKEVKRFS
jgi:uncharacterized protein (UPF0332 family)